MTATFRTLALSCIALVGSFSATAGHAACVSSLASLDGWYGLLVSGSTTGSTPAPKYLAGALLFNGTGAFTGNHVYSGAGVDTTASGTYVLNSDCTLTISLSLGSGAAQTYTVAMKQGNEAVGVETDASAVAKIDLQAQYATYNAGLNFTNASLNGTFAASCIGPAGGFSDLNLVTYANGTMKGTDPYNNSGTYAVSNNPYSGTYAINTDGTFSGTLTVDGTPFDFYGVISNVNAKVQYIYANVSSGVATAAFASCTGAAAAPIAY